MTESNSKDFDVQEVVIDENYTWKDEVERLLRENEYLKGEIVANQLMVGLVLQETGPVTIKREAISAGLEGYQIGIPDGDGEVTFELVKSE